MAEFDKERLTVMEHINAVADKMGVKGGGRFYDEIDEATRRMIEANVGVGHAADVGKLIQLSLIGLASSVGVFFATKIETEKSQDDFLQMFIKTFAEGLTATAIPMLEAVREQETENERRETEVTGRLH